MALLTLTLDMADPMAVMRYLADATEDWTDERRAALGSDIGAMLDRGDGIDMHLTPEGAAAGLGRVPRHPHAAQPDRLTGGGRET